MIELPNGKGFLCDECPLCDDVKYRLRIAAELGIEPQLEYCSCDKIDFPFYVGGYCGDAFESGGSGRELDKPRKTGRAYRRRMRQQKKQDLMRVMTYGYKFGRGYTDWGWADGVYQPVGQYIRYPKNSNRQRFWKTYSNRIVRRHKGCIGKGSSYRKYSDYVWNVD